MDKFTGLISQLAESSSGDPAAFLKALDDIGKDMNDMGKAYGLVDEVGPLLEKLSYPQLAIAVYRSALHTFEKIGEKEVHLRCLNRLGSILAEIGHFKEALNYHEEALQSALSRSDAHGKAASRASMANLYNLVGNYPAAIENYKKAAADFNKLDEKECVDAIILNLGFAYYGVGDYQQALECCNEALKIDFGEDNDLFQASCCNNMGNIYNALGKFTLALQWYKKSLEISRKIGDKAGESKYLAGIGNVYNHLKDFNQAFLYYGRALELAQAIGDKVHQGNCCTAIAMILQGTEKWDEAKEKYEEALTIYENINALQGKTFCLTNLGVLYHERKDYRKAIPIYKKAIAVDREIDSITGIALNNANIGSAYFMMGQIDKALRYYRKASKDFKKCNDRDGIRKTLVNLARISNDELNDPETAYDYCKQAIALSENLRTDLIRQEHHITFQVTLLDTYVYMVTLCMSLSKGNEAFETIEKNKSRAFLSLLASTKVHPRYDVPAELLEQEKKYQDELKSLQFSHVGGTTPWQESMDPAHLEKILKKLAFLYERIEKVDPEYVMIRKGTPLTYSEVQACLV